MLELAPDRWSWHLDTCGLEKQRLFKERVQLTKSGDYVGEGNIVIREGGGVGIHIFFSGDFEYAVLL